MNALTFDQIAAQAGVTFGRGRRKGSGAQASFSRELTEADLALASEAGEQAQPDLKSLRQSHHTLARLLAQGVKPVDVSRITGYSQSRISVLKNSPAFAELLAHYGSMEEEGWQSARADIKDRLRDVSLDSLELVQERLTDDPDSFSNKELFTLAELGLDRIGHGKQTQENKNVTVGLDRETLEAIRTSSPTSARISEEDRNRLLGAAHRAASLHSEVIDAEWSESEGDGVREEGGEVLPES